MRQAWNLTPHGQIVDGGAKHTTYTTFLFSSLACQTMVARDIYHVFRTRELALADIIRRLRKAPAAGRFTRLVDLSGGAYATLFSRILFTVRKISACKGITRYIVPAMVAIDSRGLGLAHVSVETVSGFIDTHFELLRCIRCRLVSTWC